MTVREICKVLHGNTRIRLYYKKNGRIDYEKVGEYYAYKYHETIPQQYLGADIHTVNARDHYVIDIYLQQ